MSGYYLAISCVYYAFNHTYSIIIPHTPLSLLLTFFLFSNNPLLSQPFLFVSFTR